MCEQN